jgi:hypothetical protein
MGAASSTTQSYATGDFLKEYEKPRIGGIRATVRSQRRHRYSRQVVSAHFSLAPKSRFPETETARGRDSVRMPEPDFYRVTVKRLLARNCLQARGEVFLKSSIAPSACAW